MSQPDSEEPMSIERAIPSEQSAFAERSPTVYAAYPVPLLRRPDMIVNGVPHNCHPDMCGMLKPKEHLRMIELGDRLRHLQELQTSLWHEFCRLRGLSQQVEGQIQVYKEVIDFIKTRAIERINLPTKTV